MNEGKSLTKKEGAAPASLPRGARFSWGNFYTRNAIFHFLIFAVTFGGFLFYHLSLIRSEFSDLSSRDVAAISDLMTPALSGLVQDKNTESIDAVLLAAARTSSIEEIVVSAESANYVRRVYRGGNGLFFDDTHGAFSRGGGITRPILAREGGFPIGFVRVVVSDQAQRELLARVIRDSLIASVVVLGLSLLLLHFHLRPVAQSLGKLTRIAMEMEGTKLVLEPAYKSGVTELDALSLALVRSVDRVSSQAEEIRNSREQLRLAIDNMGDGFAIFDAESRIILCNQKFAEYSPREARHLCGPGTAIQDLVANFRKDNAEQVNFQGGDVQAWLDWRSGPGGAIERSIDFHLNGERWIRGIDRLLPGGGFVSIRTDVTDLKRATLESDAANQAKSQFLANMSHEIRTPLAGIIGMADVVLDSDDLDGEQREYISLSRKSAMHLLDVVNDILDFSKIESGGMRIEELPFSLEDALADTLRIHRMHAQAKGLRLRVVDKASIERFLIGDPGRLRQILVNLLGNAIKFTDFGEVSLGIESVERTQGHSRLRFIVTDTGPGIPLEAQARLFKPFTQGDSSTQRRFGGSGLGLAISSRIAELMRGGLSFQSTPGQGAMFVLELPFKLGDILPRAQSKKNRGELHDSQGISVLVIDDNEVNLLTASRLLGKRGYRVIESKDALEGLRLIEHTRPDVILMDLQLPGIDGFEALKRIRAWEGDAARTPVIALTAHALNGYAERCIAAGFDGYVSKPFHIDTLAGEIKRLVANLAEPVQSESVKAGGAPLARFGQIVAGLDGDEKLFAEIAFAAATQFDLFSERLELLCASSDFDGLCKEAHRIKGNWAHYAAPGEELLPNLLGDAACARQSPEAFNHARRMVAALRDAAVSLRQFLSRKSELATAQILSQPVADETELTKNKTFPEKTTDYRHR